MANTHELLQQSLFFIFAGIAIFSALMVVTLNNPVRCALFLVLAFFCSAGLWILAHAEFLALILVLVYVGAVMTLFLFVVMMLDIDIESMKRHFVRYLPLGLIIVALLVGLMITAIKPEHYGVTHQVASAVSSLSNAERLGMVLYTDYVYAFELAAVLLLIAIISAIALTNRGARHSKQQDVTKQIMTNRDDRLRVVKMKATKPAE